MKPHRTHSDGHLLHHVVADSAPDDFRAATLDAMLRGARRRRHLRRARAATAALALPALAIALLWLRSPNSPAAPTQGPRELPTPPAKLAAHTPPLLVDHPGPPRQIVAHPPLYPGNPPPASLRRKTGSAPTYGLARSSSTTTSCWRSRPRPPCSSDCLPAALGCFSRIKRPNRE